MRVLVTGASGMLGSTLVERWRGAHEVFATGGRPLAFDCAVPYRAHDLRQSCDPLVAWAAPEVIVHCAALTKVDACEADPDGALDVNGRSLARLAAAAPNARIVYISSDAVLGDAPRPADEATAPRPLTAYARSKLEGERHARAHDVVVRTTVVGRNRDRGRQSFAEWIVRALRARQPITLFADVWFSPIAAADLARELEWIALHETPPLLHVAGRERVTKLAFGRALADALGLDALPITAGSVHAAGLAARRVEDQTLDCNAYECYSHRRLPELAQTVATLKAELED